MTPTELLALAREIRVVNAENGWNVTQESDWAMPYKVPAILALIHSEISEYWEERDEAKALEELADVQIRVLDLMGAATDLDFVEAFKSVQLGDFRRGVIAGWRRSDFVNEMHGRASASLEIFRAIETPWHYEFLHNLVRLFRIIDCKCGEAEMTEAIQAKLVKNRNRGHRHGGKRL